MEASLSVGDCLKFGWETFKKRPWVYLAASALINAIWIVSDVFYYSSYGDTQLGQVVTFVVSMLGAVIFTLIATTFMLKAHDNPDTISYSDIIRTTHFWKIMGAAILYGFVMVAGLILVIIPGLIAMSVFAFATYAAGDTGMRPVAALKRSRVITKGNRWKLFALILLSLMSALVYFIAIFFLSEQFASFVSNVADILIFPITALALVHAYRVLNARMPVPEEA